MPHISRFLKGPVTIILLSACLGVLLGFFLIPSYVDGIAPAQRLAGVVPYADSPLQRYFDQATYSFWIIQLPTLALRWGISESLLHALMNGFQAGIAFAAISACSLCICSLASLALLMPLLIFILRSMGLPYFGYPLLWPYTFYIPGNTGLALALLIPSLVALKCYRFAFMVAGLGPSAHAILSGLGYATAFFSLARTGEIRKLNLKITVWALPGLLLFIISYLIQWALIKAPVSPVPLEGADELVRMFSLYWGEHWKPLEKIYYWNLLPTFFILGLLFWETKSEKHSPTHAIVSGLAVVLVIGIIGTLLNGHLIAPENVPHQLKKLMLNRWLTFVHAASVILMIAYLGKKGVEQRRPLAVFLLFGVLAATCYRYYILGPEYPFGISALAFLKSLLLLDLKKSVFVLPYQLLCASIYLLLALAAFTAVLRRLGLPLKKDLKLPSHSVSVSSAVFALILVFDFGNRCRVRLSLDDERRIRLPATLSDKLDKGALLIPPGIDPYFVQILTRRPIVGGDNDGVIYSPLAALEYERMLNDFYSLSLLRREDAPQYMNFANNPMARQLWETRTSEQWRELAGKWGFATILSPPGWHLRLTHIGSFFLGELYSLKDSNNTELVHTQYLRED